MQILSIDDIKKGIEFSTFLQTHILDVALTVARMEGELDNKEEREWQLEKYHFTFNDRAGRGPYVSVHLWCLWRDRPSYGRWRYSRPEDEAEEAEDYHSSNEQLFRHVTFPLEWLTEDSWREEARVQISERRRMMAQHRMSEYRDRMALRRQERAEEDAAYLKFVATTNEQYDLDFEP